VADFSCISLNSDCLLSNLLRVLSCKYNFNQGHSLSGILDFWLTTHIQLNSFCYEL